jgi:hypothetical protein
MGQGSRDASFRGRSESKGQAAHARRLSDH